MKSPQEVISIDKETVAALPLTVYPGAITVVDTTEAADAAIEVLSREEIVGFDTETRPSFRKGHTHNTALMQISSDSHCFLFRLNKIGMCGRLKEFLENPAIKKIGLSIHDDFNVLRRSNFINPQGFVELQELVKKYDIADISLQKIYAILFGSRISKAQRLSNWEADELTPAQQTYAALDAWACLKIYEFLMSGQFDYRNSPLRHAVS